MLKHTFTKSSSGGLGHVITTDSMIEARHAMLVEEILKALKDLVPVAAHSNNSHHPAIQQALDVIAKAEGR